MIGLAAFGLLLTSCVKTEEIDGRHDPLPDGKVLLSLHTNAGGYQVPVTRAGSATDDQDNYNYTGRLPMVLVFELPQGVEYNDGNRSEKLRTESVFKEAVLAKGTTSLQVELSSTSRPVRLLVVDIPSGKYFDGTNSTPADFTEDALNAPGSPLDGKTFSQAVSGILNTEKLTVSDGAVNAVPYVSGLTPMSGYCDLGNVSTGQSGTVPLNRVVAKITVTNTAGGLTFEGATVAGTKQYGFLYRDANANPPADNKVNYLAPSGADGVINIAKSSTYVEATSGTGTTVGDPIYVYESAAGEIGIIVQGIYNGNRTWYRLLLKKSADGVPMAVERNKHYEVLITKVTGTGYPSINEALAGTISNNIVVDVVVHDLSGHEIVDNGEYYLGISNSEFLYYSDQTDQTVTVATVSTSAKSAMNVTPAISWVSGPSITPPTTFSLNATGETAYDLNMTIPAGLQKDGEALVIRVKVGNLSRDITIRRKAPLQLIGDKVQFDGDFLSAELTYTGGGWSLSENGTTEKGTEVIREGTAGKVWLIAQETNIAQTGAENREGEVYLYRHGEQGRVKALLVQPAVNYGTMTPIRLSPINTTQYYIGTFYKWNQTGERLIRVPGAGDFRTLRDEDIGIWKAFVGTEGRGLDWIMLDTEGSSAVANWPKSVDAETNKLTNGKIMVQGEATESVPFYFRVGLKSTLETVTSRPRYGVIYLLYNNYTTVRKIYVRQGEEPDYVLHPSDVGPNAKKWMVYNLRWKNGTGTTYEQVATNGAGLTDFPTKAGSYFQFSAPATGVRRAYYPNYGNLTPTTDWINDNYKEFTEDQETCPVGYRRPTGKEGGEAHISLQMNIDDTFAKNYQWGFYADGFFDRQVITKPTASDAYGGTSPPNGTCVKPNTRDVAYTGGICINEIEGSPWENAHVFFPSSGDRHWENGGLAWRGQIGDYWTSNPEYIVHGCEFSIHNSGLNAKIINSPRSTANTIRCVKIVND